MTKSLALKLGVEAKDRVTGFKGLVIQKVEQVSGNVMWAIQPRGRGTTIPEAYNIDGHLLEVTGIGISKLLPPVDDTPTLILGEAVQDVVTGLKGIATEKITFQNGCVHFTVVSKLTKDGKDVHTYTIDHKRLKRTGPGISVRQTKSAKDTAADHKGPGGPSRRTNSIRSI